MEEQQLWGKIWYLFNPKNSLDETRVHINYQISSENLRKVQELIRDMNLAVSIKTEQLGLKGVNPLGMKDEQRTAYSEALKADDRWKEGFFSILKACELDIDSGDAIRRISRPWWLTINFANDPSKDVITLENHYHVTPNVYPSLISQLIEAGMPGLNFPEALRPCSVINALHTADGKLMYGLRGGANFANVYMPVAVGSVELHLEPGEGDSLFGSNRKELGEELAFTRGHYKDSRLVAIAEETHIAKGGWLYYVFDTETALTQPEIIEHWKRAVDREEHQKLEGFDCHDPQSHLEFLIQRAFDKSKADPKQVNRVTPVNYNTFLPQAILSTASYFVSQYGKDFAMQALQTLEGHFDLTSCFER